mmetsp:Transcript_2002/g.4721  ORF Transcript_2002/g.4721 Transcript_2002/m.4721 type:complete len:97 (+) Transcript_2002:2408-2698(+)
MPNDAEKEHLLDGMQVAIREGAARVMTEEEEREVAADREVAEGPAVAAGMILGEKSAVVLMMVEAASTVDLIMASGTRAAARAMAAGDHGTRVGRG